jgi:hypothetical protein
MGREDKGMPRLEVRFWFCRRETLNREKKPKEKSGEGQPLTAFLVHLPRELPMCVFSV